MAELSIWHSFLPHQRSDLQMWPMCLLRETSKSKFWYKQKKKYKTFCHFSNALINSLTFWHGHVTNVPVLKPSQPNVRVETHCRDVLVFKPVCRIVTWCLHDFCLHQISTIQETIGSVLTSTDVSAPVSVGHQCWEQNFFFFFFYKLGCFLFVYVNVFGDIMLIYNVALVLLNLF